MNNFITIIEGLLYAVKKVDGKKVCYYLKGVKHFEIGKTFKWVQFIEKADFEKYEKEFSK